MSFRWMSWITAACVLMVAAWASWLGHPTFPLDDAYISQHAASTIFSSSDPRYPESTPLHGVTSPVHILLLALLGSGLSLPWAQLVVAGLAFYLYLTGIFKLGLAHGLNVKWCGAVTSLAVLAGYSLYHFANGLETGLAMAVITWLFIFFKEPTPSHRAHYLLLGVLPFVRPELAALSAAFAFRAFISLRRNLPEMTRAASLMAASAAPFGLWLAIKTGLPVPNTIEAKKFFFAEACLPGSWKFAMLSRGFLSFLFGLGIASIGFLLIPLSRFTVICLLFMGGFLSALFLQLPGGPWHNFARYMYIFAPLVFLGWISALSNTGPLSKVVKPLLVGAIAWSIYHLPIGLAAYKSNIDLIRHDLAGAAEWASSNIDSAAPILVHDAGYLSIAGTQPLVDVVGLKTPSSVDVHRNLTWAVCGQRNAAAIDYIARRSGARFFVVLDDWDNIFRLTDSLRLMGWIVKRADSERGPTKYKVYHITPP